MFPCYNGTMSPTVHKLEQQIRKLAPADQSDLFDRVAKLRLAALEKSLLVGIEQLDHGKMLTAEEVRWQIQQHRQARRVRTHG